MWRSSTFNIDCLQIIGEKSFITNGCDAVGNGYLSQACTSIVFASCFISTTCVLNGRKVMTQIL